MQNRRNKANANGNGNGNGKPRAKNNGRNRRSRFGNPTTIQAVQMGIQNAQANVRPVNQQVSVLKGSDFLTTITVLPAPTTAQRVLKELFISPSYFPGTRLTQMSQLWERYRFTSFRLRYVPAVPTTLACQLIVYFDTDPLDDPADALDPEVLVRQAVAHTGAQQWNFNLAKVIPLPIRADDQLYYTGDIKTNERFSLQAKAYVLQVTDPLNFNGDALTDDTVSGSLYIDWVCKFQLPQINPAGYALRSTALIKDVVESGVTIPDLADGSNEVELTGFKPLKTYLGMFAKMTDNSAITSSVYAQPRLSLRELFAVGTYRMRTAFIQAASTTDTHCYATSDAKGVLRFWVYATAETTTTAALEAFFYEAS